MVREQKDVKRMAQKTRKNPYVPGKAALEFKPDFDWTIEEAKELYERKKADDSIIYQDCIDHMKRVRDETFDMVLADPPFGIDFDGKSSAYNRNPDNVAEGYSEIDDYADFTEEWISEVARIAKSSAQIWIVSGWTKLEDVLRGIRMAGLETVNHNIWKYNFALFTRKKFASSHYHVLLCSKKPKRMFFNKVLHYIEDVWIINKRYRKGEMKNGNKLPEEVVLKCIDFGSRPGDLVYDPFMGNGTTAVCCKGSWRHYIGSEININMGPIIRNNLDLVKEGEMYVPYTERWQEILKSRGHDPKKCGNLTQTTIPRILFEADGTALFEERENLLRGEDEN